MLVWSDGVNFVSVVIIILVLAVEMEVGINLRRAGFGGIAKPLKTLDNVIFLARPV